jgi:hypothetical protein
MLQSIIEVNSYLKYTAIDKNWLGVGRIAPGVGERVVFEVFI